MARPSGLGGLHSGLQASGTPFQLPVPLCLAPFLLNKLRPDFNCQPHSPLAIQKVFQGEVLPGSDFDNFVPRHAPVLIPESTPDHAVFDCLLLGSAQRGRACRTSWVRKPRPPFVLVVLEQSLGLVLFVAGKFGCHQNQRICGCQNSGLNNVRELSNMSHICVVVIVITKTHGL